jgi:hypothetical protein
MILRSSVYRENYGDTVGTSDVVGVGLEVLRKMFQKGWDLKSEGQVF